MNNILNNSIEEFVVYDSLADFIYFLYIFSICILQYSIIYQKIVKVFCLVYSR